MDTKTVGTLVAKAFCLEALADKTDCTSRFVDLPNRPLEGFVVAGINSAPFFQLLTSDRLNGSPAIYQHYEVALKASNLHKSAKYINFGLLEIMFPVVCARLLCDNPDMVVKEINNVLMRGGPSDVEAMLVARKLAWSTSTTPNKHDFEFGQEMRSAKSPAEFYERVHLRGEADTSSRQWTEQYHQGWPILQEIFTRLQKSKKHSLLDKISDAFNPVRKKYPVIRIGILADMCAAAIFLYLSYEE